MKIVLNGLPKTTFLKLVSTTYSGVHKLTIKENFESFLYLSKCSRISYIQRVSSVNFKYSCKTVLKIKRFYEERSKNLALNFQELLRKKAFQSNFRAPRTSFEV